jgi:hypothetical protein
MRGMKIEPCERCGRAVRTAENINESGEPCVIIYTVLRTSGVRPMIRAGARRRVFDMPCAMSIGLGPKPESGAFNEDVYNGCAEIAGKGGMRLMETAHEQRFNPPTRPRLMPGSKPDDTLTNKVLSTPYSNTVLAS